MPNCKYIYTLAYLLSVAACSSSDRTNGDATVSDAGSSGTSTGGKTSSGGSATVGGNASTGRSATVARDTWINCVLAYVEHVRVWEVEVLTCIEELLALLDQGLTYVEELLPSVKHVFTSVEGLTPLLEQRTTSSGDVFDDSWRLAAKSQIRLPPLITRSAPKTRRLIDFESPEP